MGEYENDYYTIGKVDCIDCMGNKVSIYHIFWLDRGTRVSGYLSASEARNSAERTVRNQRIREGLPV